MPIVSCTVPKIIVPDVALDLGSLTTPFIRNGEQSHASMPYNFPGAHSSHCTPKQENTATYKDSTKVTQITRKVQI